MIKILVVTDRFENILWRKEKHRTVIRLHSYVIHGWPTKD